MRVLAEVGRDHPPILHCSCHSFGGQQRGNRLLLVVALLAAAVYAQAYQAETQTAAGAKFSPYYGVAPYLNGAPTRAPDQPTYPVQAAGNPATVVAFPPYGRETVGSVTPLQPVPVGYRAPPPPSHLLRLVPRPPISGTSIPRPVYRAIDQQPPSYHFSSVAAVSRAVLQIAPSGGGPPSAPSAPGIRVYPPVAEEPTVKHNEDDIAHRPARPARPADSPNNPPLRVRPPSVTNKPVTERTHMQNSQTQPQPAPQTGKGQPPTQAISGKRGAHEQESAGNPRTARSPHTTGPPNARSTKTAVSETTSIASSHRVNASVPSYPTNIAQEDLGARRAFPLAESSAHFTDTQHGSLLKDTQKGARYSAEAVYPDGGPSPAVEPEQEFVCPIHVSTPKLCFSDDDCPITSEEGGSWVCVTLRPRIEGVPGVCRLVCDGDPDFPCPVGQFCTSQIDTAVCVEFCPPDGMPPCERVTCGSLQYCTRNWCRTHGALLDPSLCVLPFSQRDQDFFCIN